MRAVGRGLPPAWVRALAADYRGLGWDVEEGADWIRVDGLPQEELDRRLNDPLGTERRAPRRRKGAEPLAEEERIDAPIREEVKGG